MSAAPVAAGGERAPGDSAFEASSFERTLGLRIPSRWMNWRRRALVLAALLGCLGVFSLARWLAATPQLGGDWGRASDGQLMLLAGNNLPQLDGQRGQTLLRVLAPGRPALEVDSLLLHRSPRWQVDDALRARQVAQHEGLAAALRTPGPVQLQFANGAQVVAPVALRSYFGLGVLFWPLAGLSLLLYLFGVVVLLARPQPRNWLYVTMAWCQAANLLFIALESSKGLGLPLLGSGSFSGDFALRVALDLVTGAAAVTAFALHPRRLPGAGRIAAAAWGAVALWLLLTLGLRPPGLWWWAQGSCIVLGTAALMVIDRSHRVEPNPYALVMRRFAAVTLATLVLASVAVAIASRMPEAAPRVVAWASGAWYLFLASLLLLTPFLARSRQVLREFAMLAGISTVATSLDLLFVAVFSLGPFASLAVAVFIALGLYAGARQWMLNHLIGNSMLTTERTFDQIYRAAREVQAKPARYTQRLALLLRELFDPLEVLRVDRVPVHARVVGGGSALLVPMRSKAGEDNHDPAAKPAPSAALLLRFAHRGQRLFTLEDARLADRVVDQLRRAVAYDQAVERGRNEERMRIAQDLHDDIGARLLTLMYQAQTPEMENYIRHTLQDLKTLTRGLAVAEHLLSHAGAEWKADLTQRLTAASVSLGWSFNFDRDMKLTVVQWSALTRVLRELVSNSLYHGHASRIDVQLQIEGPLLTLQVADNGRGRQPQSWAHGLGMGGVRKRVKILRGEVSWQENAGRGIVCRVRVPEFATEPPSASRSARIGPGGPPE